MIVLYSPVKVALRRAIALTSKGLALDTFICRFHIDLLEPYVSPYCPVLRVLAGCLVPLSEIGLLTGLACIEHSTLLY